MELKVREEGNTVYFEVIGSIDTDGAPELSVRFADIVKNADIEHAVFDLSRVPSTTSSGIGKLLTFFKHFDKRGGTMKVKGISDALLEQFKEIHLDLIIPIER